MNTFTFTLTRDIQINNANISQRKHTRRKERKKEKLNKLRKMKFALPSHEALNFMRHPRIHPSSPPPSHVPKITIHNNVKHFIKFTLSAGKFSHLPSPPHPSPEFF